MDVTCKFCGGSGKIWNILWGNKPCEVCHGAGELSIDIPKEKAINCKFCGGSGKVYDIMLGDMPCNVCKGIGIIARPSVDYETTPQRKSVPSVVTRPSHFKYDIAISYASENRDVAERYANLLTKRVVSVFYDKNEEANLWGKDLYEKLDDIYRHQAKYCVLFISQEYAKKLWTTHERKSAQARAFKENEEYILPVRLDDTEIPGIRETVGYIDLREHTISELVELTLKKLASYHKGVAKE